MQPTNKATFNVLLRMRRRVVVVFALLLLMAAVIGIVSALQINTATSSAFFAKPSLDPAVAAPRQLPFGLEADPAEHELYRLLDEQCREQIESKTYAPMADCR